MEFVGRVADRCIRDRYVGKGVSGLYAPGSANPIRYVKAAYSRKALAEIHRVLEDIDRCIRDRYVGKGVSGLYAPGSANPIRYVKAAYSRKALAEIHRVLEDIELTGEKREWCSNFSFYDPLQDDPYGLENSLNELLDLAY